MADIKVDKLETTSPNFEILASDDITLAANYSAGVSGAQMFMDGSSGTITTNGQGPTSLGANYVIGSSGSNLYLSSAGGAGLYANGANGLPLQTFVEVQNSGDSVISATNDAYVVANYSAGVSGSSLILNGGAGTAELVSFGTMAIGTQQTVAGGVASLIMTGSTREIKMNSGPFIWQSTGSALWLADAGTGNALLQSEGQIFLNAPNGYISINTGGNGSSSNVPGAFLTLGAVTGGATSESTLSTNGVLFLRSDYSYGSTGSAIELFPGADANLNLVADSSIVFFTGGASRWTISSDGALSGTGGSYVYTTGSVIINNGSPTMYFQDTDHRSAMIHVNGNLFHILRGAGTNSLGWEATNGLWPLIINLENNDATFGGHLFMPSNRNIYCSLFREIGLGYYVWINSSGQSRLAFETEGMFRSALDNFHATGWPGYRWTSVWAANGTIQTSDSRLKTNIQNSVLGLDFINALRPVSYKWIDGKTVVNEVNGEEVVSTIPGQRTHWGLIAQEVKTVIDAAGVDFGGWVLNDVEDPDSTQSLRYDQFVAPLIKAVQELKADCDAKQAAIDDLLARVIALETP